MKKLAKLLALLLALTLAFSLAACGRRTRPRRDPLVRSTRRGRSL